VGVGACVNCGAENRPGAKFCGECGHSLAMSCPACGEPAPTGKFCSECGTPLQPGATAPAPSVVPSAGAARVSGADASAPVSERRVVSLLFGDLVGFTPLSESRDPEAVRELLSAYFERARAVVERYGGTVEKFIGDAVFAVWGVPVTREDDAELAVRAGLDLVSAVAALGQEVHAEGLQMRVGVTTGQVAVTLGAVGEGMVAGDAVNTAARVQAVASPGEVWVDDPTRSLTSAALAYESAGKHELKGKSLPLELFRAVRTTGVLGGEQRVDGLEAPFVGRDRELRMVKELFHATAEEARPRLVLVAGDPGIGKSRLSWEFEKYLDAIKSHWSFWLRGRCLSYGQGVAGRVVAEMVRSLLRVTDTDDEETVRAALNERLHRHVPDDAVRDVLRPRLESLLGLSDRAFEQADMFACWRGFFEALTHEDNSVVTLVVEDLQWADDAFLDFIDYLLESAQAPIMLLAMARPDITTRRAGIGAGRRSTTVFLEPLPDAAMRQLLDGLVGNLPETLRDELIRRADGIPLYAVETVRSLIDRDVVVPEGGRYVVDPAAAGALDLARLAPPATLHALLAARLDALTPDERRVVQDGSVLGLTFTQAGIQSLTTVTGQLDEVLASLRRKEILNVDNDPRSPERGQFRFVQALLRSVAYETLSRRDRKSRHIAVAQHLATYVEGDAIAGVLAQHYLDAAAAVPEDDDVAELRRRAAEMFERAALHAADVGAPVDALTHYAQLMAHEPPDDMVLRTVKAASLLARRTGRRIDEVLEWTEQALTIARAAADEDDELWLRLSRSMMWYSSGQNFATAEEEAKVVFEASVHRPERVNMLALAARQLCIAAQVTGDTEVVQDAATRALDSIEKYGDDLDFAALLDTLSMWFALVGYRRLTVLVRRAAAAQADPRNPASLSMLSNFAANIVYDDPVEAESAASTARESSRLLGMNELVSIGHLVAAYLCMGRFDDAIGLLNQQAADERSQLVDWETYLVTGSALLAWHKDDVTLMRPPIDEAKDSEDVVVAGWWLMRDAIGAAFHRDIAAGATIAAESVDRMALIGRAHEDMPFAYALAVDMLIEAGETEALARITTELDTLRPGQRFRLLDGQMRRARAHLSNTPVAGLREAVEIFDAMNAAFWAARTRVELAAALADAGDKAAATTTLSAAEPFLREIGAARALRQIDDIRARTGIQEIPLPRHAEPAVVVD